MAMKSRKNLLAVLAVSVIAMAVAIAGCSSSSSDKSAGGTPPETPPPAAELLATALRANTKSADASEEAARVADEASKVKYGAKDVNGESNKAVKNAQSVLSAEKEMEAAVEKAQTALEDADSARKKAEAHEDEDLNALLRAAIEVVAAQVKEAQDSQNKLKAAVANVENPPDGKTDPAPDPLKTPAYHGDKVAKTISNALEMAFDTRRQSHSDSLPDKTLGGLRLDDDHSGVTWADIAGNVVMEMRIAFGGNAKVVEAASIKGTTSVKGLADDEGTLFSPGDDIDDGLQLSGFWKGIRGIVFCQGKDCGVESGESGGFKLTGSWYFTPNLDKFYVKKADESGDYELALYAKYGHWLTFDDDGVATVNTYATTDHGKTDHGKKGVWTVSADPGSKTMLTDTSASYSGNAAGMSVRDTFKPDGTVGKTQSGAFTATVSLTATFGSKPALAGKVSQFEGAAVNSDWSVTLEESLVDRSSGTANGSTATGTNGGASDPDGGAWSATSYGNDGARPTGIYGDFKAHFRDGRAVGAYATRKTRKQ